MTSSTVRMRAALALAALLFASWAQAWGPDGHHTVGALADRLIAGSPAALKVKALLGDLSLQDAAVWADCAKGIDPDSDFAYTTPGKYPECKIYETPQGEAEMAAFVRRNATNCQRLPTDDICHAQYHYSDIAIQRDHYIFGPVGTRDDDIVAAVTAAIDVLQGRPSPSPFNIQGQREALLLLAHYVGDIHQPLHVGAVYLAATGALVDPDLGSYNAATATRGGNQITTIDAATGKKGPNLHFTWDQIPASLMVDQVGTAWVNRARKTAPTPGDLADWSTAWATGTLLQARHAFRGLAFGPLQGADWSVPLSSAYRSRMATIKRQQLTLAGARLAQVLQALWP